MTQCGLGVGRQPCATAGSASQDPDEKHNIQYVTLALNLYNVARKPNRNYAFEV